MCLHVWGIDFHRGNEDLRSQLFFPLVERKKILQELSRLGFQDLVYLHTCNRVEFYTTAVDHFADTKHLWRALFQKRGLNTKDYYQGYHLEGKSALRHLLRVACSLESMVVGEPQVLGQLKKALEWTKAEGFYVHSYLQKCFQTAFEAAKRVRSDTSLGESPISIASLGIARLEIWQDQYPLKRVAIVGRGEMSLRFLNWFIEHHPRVPLIWVNRSTEKLKQYVESEHVELVSLEQFVNHPPDFSHLVTSTSSPFPIFNSHFLKQCGSGKVYFDFAEPADIARPVYGDSVLCCTTDFAEESQKNSNERLQAVGEAEKIIEESLKTFYLALKQAPVLKDFNEVEPDLEIQLNQALDLIREEFPAPDFLKIQKWASKLVKDNLHRSRGHLKAILNRAVEPRDGSIPI